MSSPRHVSVVIRDHLESPLEEALPTTDRSEMARSLVMGWLLDELFDAEDDLLALVARPEALVGWRRERLGEFCQRAGATLLAE